MLDFFAHVFDTSDFPARWNCGNWSNGHGWLHVLSDLGVWSAYVAIPCVLGYFILRRRDLPYRSIFVLFGAFILACGTTHLMEAAIFWWPAYRLAGLIKLGTAVISWATVMALVPITPRILAMRSPEELAREIVERERAEQMLRQNAQELELKSQQLIEAERLKGEMLEQRVSQRTEELTAANDGLQAEVMHRKLLEADLRRSVSQQAALAELSRWALLGENLDSLIGRTVSLVSVTLGVELTCVLELQPDGRELLLKAGLGWKEGTVGQARVGAGVESPAGYALLARQAALHGQPIHEPLNVDDLRSETRFRAPPLFQEHGVVSGVNAVIFGRNRPYGVLEACSAFQRGFHNDEARFLQAMANVLAAVVQREHAGHSTQLLIDASTALSALADFESAMQKVARLAVPFLADQCTVYMIGENGQIQCVAAVHVNSEKESLLLQILEEYPIDWNSKTTITRVLHSGRAELMAEVTEEVIDDSARDARQRDLIQQLSPQSHLCVPLMIREQPCGVLAFTITESDRQYTPGDLSVAEDLARRAAVALDNARLYADARTADRRKDEFLAMLAHELRNPLAPLRNAIPLLRSGDLVPEVIETMERQVEQLVRIVDDLLDVSRIMRGKVSLQIETVRIGDVVERAVETSRPIIDEHAHELLVSVPAEPLCVDADEIRLAQVISNLLNNAAKYTEPHGRISLTVRQESDRLAIYVQDSGIGIESDLLPRVFDLFTQADRALDRSQGGLGIGLSLVRSLVEMHGGSVTARSEGQGKGSEFIVRLPVSTKKPDGREAEWKPAGARKRRVLIVEDNVGAARILGRMLTTFWHHEVEMVHDGRAAVEAAKVFKPEVVLLDVGLPGLDGYEIARRLRQLPEFTDVLLVALTGYGTEEDRRRSQAAGFDLHLVKPPAVATLQGVFEHEKLHA